MEKSKPLSQLVENNYLLDGDVVVCAEDMTSGAFKEGKRYRLFQYTDPESLHKSLSITNEHGKTVACLHIQSSRFYVADKVQKPKAHKSLRKFDKPEQVKGTTDGLTADYYVLPSHATELKHIISHRGMSKARGDIFKACYRMGLKEGVSIQYDINKIKSHIADLEEMLERGEHI